MTERASSCGTTDGREVRAIQVLEELLGESPLEHEPAGNGTEVRTAEGAAGR